MTNQILRRSQCGAVLLLMLVLIILTLSSLIIQWHRPAREQQAITWQNLAQAKEALINYAVTYGDLHAGEVPGYLPCPDLNGGNGEGSSALNCGNKNVSQLGHFPWKTLKLTPLRAGDSECLWYAVSGTYKNNPQTDLMNWDTNGQFQIYAADGSTRLDRDDNQVVAVIIAPGSAQTGQDRSGIDNTKCGNNYTASAFLDNDSVHGFNNADILTGKFIQTNLSGNVNDQIMPITRNDIWRAIQKRSDFNATLQLLTQRIAECVADYGNNNPAVNGLANLSLPWPAVLAPTSPNYGSNDKYNDKSDLFVGRVPFVVDTSRAKSLNKMSSTLLMTAKNGLLCPYYTAAAPSTELERLYPWWNNWKDHYFYALSKTYQPSNTATGTCGDCLQINAQGNYAGIVMFAGHAIEGVTRANTSINNVERGLISNYLEGRNASNFGNSAGNTNYQHEVASATFNDLLFCISENNSKLVTAPCPLP